MELGRERTRLDPEVRFTVFAAGAVRATLRARARKGGVLGEVPFMFDTLPKALPADWAAGGEVTLALITGPRVIWEDAEENECLDAVAAGKPIAMNFDDWQTQIVLNGGIGIPLNLASPSSSAQRLVVVVLDDAGLREVPARAARLADGQLNRGHLALRLPAALDAAARAGPKPKHPPEAP